MISIDQTHLTRAEQANFGGFYTPPDIVEIVQQMIDRNIESNPTGWTVLDSSCGYGALFNIKTKININQMVGSDIDTIALKAAREKHPNARLFDYNALVNVCRGKYGIEQNTPLIVVSNPPYNDTTSLVKHKIKKGFLFEADSDIQAHDLGISFIRSFEKLSPEYMLVIHPLSYLIKKMNFNRLKPVFNRYSLKDCIIISSQRFHNTSRIIGFPIVVALYEKNMAGIKYEDMKQWNFRTDTGENVSVNEFDYVKNYIVKYPNLKTKPANWKGHRFFSMRDINALKRSRTFISEDTSNTIYIDPDKLEYYCYIDAFKGISKSLPYYFGNFDVPIAHEKFESIKSDFLVYSAAKHPFMFPKEIKKLKQKQVVDSCVRIELYFRELFEKHKLSKKEK